MKSSVTRLGLGAMHLGVLLLAGTTTVQAEVPKEAFSCELDGKIGVGRVHCPPETQLVET